MSPVLQSLNHTPSLQVAPFKPKHVKLSTQRRPSLTVTSASNDSTTASGTRSGEVLEAFPLVLGGAGLVTGSAVGAGILALPAVTHASGFGPSAAVLCTCWLVLQLEALLLVEVNLSCHEARKQLHSEGKNLPPILLADATRMTLGRGAESAVTSIYLTMSFTLLLAYIDRAGSIIDGALTLDQSQPFILGSFLFAAPLASVIIRGGTEGGEKCNSALTALMLVLFTAVVAWGFSQIPWDTSPLSYASTSDIASTLPIMFLSLVYHDLIPVVCNYLGYQRSHILTAVFLGSIVPLMMFVSFEAVCLGLVQYSPLDVVDPVDVLINSHGPLAGTAVAVFSLAALATSAIGTTLSLSSFFRSKLEAFTTVGDLPVSSNNPVPAPGTGSQTPEPEGPSMTQVAAVCLTLGPPTLASLSGTDLFLTATHLAGAYGMTALYGLLPPALAWSVRRNAESSGSQLLPGGVPTLVGLFIMGCIVEGMQLREDLSLGTQIVSGQSDMGLSIAGQMLTTVSGTGAGAEDLVFLM